MKFPLILPILTATVFLVSGTSAVFAQAGPPSTDGGAGESTPDVRYDPSRPVPYDPDEFPPWARNLRRGEVIALGAFPVAMIVTSLGYELGRFGYQSVRRGAPSGEYAPWFFSTSPEGPFSNEERIGLVLSSAAISVGVALVDYILGRRENE
jgi:hypothetical protein